MNYILVAVIAIETACLILQRRKLRQLKSSKGAVIIPRGRVTPVSIMDSAVYNSLITKHTRG